MIALEGGAKADGIWSDHDHVPDVAMIPLGFVTEVSEVGEDSVGRSF
jgi:hypothetical protein